MAGVPQPAQSALAVFSQVFHDEVEYSGPMGAAWAPGRVNLIGEHTDYNDGFVLPIAIDRVTAFAGRARNDGVVRLWSTHFQEYVTLEVASPVALLESQREGLPAWARYILAVMGELVELGVEVAGFDAVVSGDVPPGGGMSSSAALEVATAHACELFSGGHFTIGEDGATLAAMEVARLCQRAEHVAMGVQCGILDQAASCLGRPGQALLLDCRSLDYRYLPFSAPDLSLVVIDTGVRRELAGSAYNERRRQCEEAARMLGEIIVRHEPGNEEAAAIPTLRDVTVEQFARYGGELPEPLRRRARFIIAEEERVFQVVKLLEADDFVGIGALLWEAHVGLRDDYEVSCGELDALVEIARQVSGVLGARMLGGGFGGCTINLVRNEAVGALREAVGREYPVRTGRRVGVHGNDGFDICRAAGGPGRYWVRDI